MNGCSVQRVSCRPCIRFDPELTARWGQDVTFVIVPDHCRCHARPTAGFHARLASSGYALRRVMQLREKCMSRDSYTCANKIQEYKFVSFPSRVFSRFAISRMVLISGLSIWKNQLLSFGRGGCAFELPMRPLKDRRLPLVLYVVAIFGWVSRIRL